MAESGLVDSTSVQFHLKATTSQTIHGHVEVLASSVVFHITFVYGANDRVGRIALWNELRRLALLTNQACLVLGDFNSILSSEDRLGGTLVTDAECSDFREAISDSHLQRLQYIGWDFSWCNWQPANLIYTKN